MMKKWGIKHRVLSLALVPTITISLLLGIYFINLRLNDISQALNDRGTAIASRLASAGEYGVFAGNTQALRTLARLALDNEVSSVAFYDKDGKELASAGKLSSRITPPSTHLNSVHIIQQPETDTLAFIVPVTLPEVIIDDYPDASQSIDEAHLKATVIGWLKVELERKATRLKEYQVLIHSTLIALLGLSISGLVALRIGARVTHPIIEITDAVEKIRQGKLSTRVHTQAVWELEILRSGINAMASSMQSAHEELQSNVKQATADLRQTLETIEIQNIELEIARKEAEAASAVKSEFLASMSHELRTPLNGIIGFINLMQKTSLSAQQKDYLLTIQKSATNLLSIINDILDFSKIEAGKLRLDAEPMDVRECIDDAVTLLAPSAHDKSLEIIPFIYQDVPQLIQGDALRIKQVITNLVNNSIKFTEHGSIVVRVMLDEIHPDNDVTLCISVSDTGIGLTEEQQARLFQAFDQINPKMTRKLGGTGLGLVICKRLVEQMGGKIELESAPGKGSTFWFTLHAKKLQTQIHDLEPKHLQGLRILFFERHPVTRVALVQLLKTWGIIVEEVEHADEIEPKVKKQHDIGLPYHMVLVGMNQPKKSETFIKDLITCIKEPYQCPVGILANTTDFIVHNDILLLGACLCLAKPVCRKKLFNALSELFLNRKNSMTKQIRFTKLNILAVDDNPANLKLLCALLDNIGTQVVTAESGQRACQLVYEQHFDLILMDIHMPVMDGFETTRNIRKSDGHNQNTPIVALSAHFLLSERESFSQVGINDYLTKPINEHQLRATIYKWTQQGIIHESDAKPNVPKTEEAEETMASIDWALSKRLAGGKEDLAQEMLNMLASSLPNEQKTINLAFANKDYDALREYVHKLHGACCYCGVPRLKRLAKQLECSLTTPDSSNIDEQVHELNEEINQILNILNADSLEETS